MIRVGDRRGALTVVATISAKDAGFPSDHGRWATVHCDCGKEKTIRARHMAAGRYLDCGCELVKKRKSGGEVRWGGDRRRPGVEACGHAGPGGWNREAGQYAVVTARKRTVHDTFDEAAVEFRLRRGMA